MNDERYNRTTIPSINVGLSIAIMTVVFRTP
jgi:hypothetical protein